MGSAGRGNDAIPGGPGAPSRPPPIRRIAIVATASGNGKTTLGRRLAAHLAAPFVELDAAPRPGLDGSDG